jgi:hypothetical protein
LCVGNVLECRFFHLQCRRVQRSGAEEQPALEHDQEAQLNDALHFGYETYGQDGPPAPLNPLDYPHYDYEDPRDLD